MASAQKSRRELLSLVHGALSRLTASPAADREIWYRRFQAGYWPCHWRGWALALGAMAIVAVVNLIVGKFAPYRIGLALLANVPIVIALWVMAERHSEPRK